MFEGSPAMDDELHDQERFDEEIIPSSGPITRSPEEKKDINERNDKVDSFKAEKWRNTRKME